MKQTMRMFNFNMINKKVFIRIAELGHFDNSKLDICILYRPLTSYTYSSYNVPKFCVCNKYVCKTTLFHLMLIFILLLNFTHSLKYDTTVIGCIMEI